MSRKDKIYTNLKKIKVKRHELLKSEPLGKIKNKEDLSTYRNHTFFSSSFLIELLVFRNTIIFVFKINDIDITMNSHQNIRRKFFFLILVDLVTHVPQTMVVHTVNNESRRI